MPKNAREKKRSHSYNARAAARAIEEQQSVRSRSLSPAGTEKSSEGKLICDTKTSTPSKNPTSPDEKDHEIDISPIKSVGRDSGFTGCNETSLEMSSDGEEDDMGYYESNEEFDCNAGVDNPLLSKQEEESEELKAFQQEIVSSDQDSGCEKSTENSNSKGSNEVLNKSFKGTSNSGRGGIPKSSFGASHSQEESPETVYQKLSKVRFSDDDSGNSHEWADIDRINSYVNKALTSKNGVLAHYIGPNNFGFGSTDRVKDIAKHICKRDVDNRHLNDFYDPEKPLDKPFIIISNTDTVRVTDNNVNKGVGSHWVSWVLLPKKYTALSGKQVNNNGYQVYFFDSLKANRSFPKELKRFLVEGGELNETTDTGEHKIKLIPLCTKEEIEVVDISHLTGQQQGINESDCGWWAVYYALMTVYTGGMEFLEPLEGKTLSAMPLREIMDLQEPDRSPQDIGNTWSRSEKTLLPLQAQNSRDTFPRGQRGVPLEAEGNENKDPEKHSPSKRIHGQQRPLDGSGEVMRRVFHYVEFKDHDLGDNESPSRKKFVSIVEDLEKKGCTYQGSIKFISSKGSIKYLRAKLSDKDRLLFTQVKYNGEDIFVMLEVVPNHDYNKSDFLGSKDKTRKIKVEEMKVTGEVGIEKSSGNIRNVKIEDLQRAHWLGKPLTFSATQENIVKDVEDCKLPLVISGAAGSGKTSVALESLKKMQEKFKGRKILYITKSKNLVEESKKLLGCEHYNKTTNKYETRVPEEIEFLSVHEFIEKVTKEGAEMRKSVEGKKPVNRNAFFSWFNEKCKRDKFKKYKKDGDKIFEELMAVIGGGGLLGKDQYVNLGDRQSIFPKEKRANIYSLFEEYKKFIEESSEYYDTSLIAYECVKKVQKVYDAVVVDEVQDLTESTLGLILKSLKDESNFLLCGDVNQVIHPSFFSMSRLKHFFRASKGKELKFSILEKNYRNSKQVIEFANRILHFKNYHFASEDKMTEGEKKAFFMKSSTENPGNVGFIAKGDEQKIAGKISESTNWAVLVLDDESKEDACKLFKTPLVFSIQEAKGLEFENVILYKFTSDKAYNEIWNVACPDKDIESTIKEIRNSYDRKDVNTSRTKNKEDKSFEDYKFYMNALYVAVTRAINNVYIVGDEEQRNLLKVVAPEEKVDVDIGNIKKEESTPEGWRDIALKLIDEGNIEQAKGIALKLLRERKGEYAKEIMSALKVQEKDHTQESQLPLDKNEQAISELKTENPTQESSMDKSSTSAEKSRKRKSQQNRNEKKKSKRLEQNTKELFSALDSHNLQLAEQLIEQGVNVNAKGQKGDTCLHFTAQFNYYHIAKRLLNLGAKVNAQGERNWTPLHLAAREGYNSMVELLLENGANVNAKAYDDTTPLHLAAQNGHKDVVQILLNHGAKVDAKTSKGATPLHVAAQNSHKDTVELLLENGANVNAETRVGSTPLHFAAGKGYNSVVELLLNRGANANAKACDGTTPLHLVAKRSVGSVVKPLLDHGADINAKTSGGCTPLALALEYSSSEVVALLLADPNINVGCVKVGYARKEEDRKKLVCKLVQDCQLFNALKQAEKEVDENKVEEIKKLLALKNEYGLKPSLNYSPDGNDENTTTEIAIKAGGKLLQLLYDYAKKHIGKDTKIFKQLKHAKEQQENSQLKSDLSDVSVSNHLTQFKACN